MSLWARIRRELGEIYVDLLALPPFALLGLSCLALFLAASIAFGIHP